MVYKGKKAFHTKQGTIFFRCKNHQMLQNKQIFKIAGNRKWRMIYLWRHPYWQQLKLCISEWGSGKRVLNLLGRRICCTIYTEIKLMFCTSNSLTAQKKSEVCVLEPHGLSAQFISAAQFLFSLCCKNVQSHWWVHFRFQVFTLGFFLLQLSLLWQGVLLMK